ncbi:MAG: phosphotransferase family protein [Thermoleophilia bacterium]
MNAAGPSRHLTSHREGLPGPAFVKRPRSPARREDLLREAAVYGVLRDRCPATAARVPGRARWNAVGGELEMDRVPGVTLTDHVAATGVLDPVVAAAVGTAVGELHAESAGPTAHGPTSDWMRHGVGIVRPTPAGVRLMSTGEIALLKRLQRDEELEARLRDLAPDASGTLVHGDLRWANVLVTPAGEPAVRLVDWEMGGAGEPAWDAGCFAAACVSAWLCSIPAVPGVTSERLAVEAELPIEILWPGLGAFWTAYGDAATRPQPDAWRTRCAQLTAVRLVYMAFEFAQLDAVLRQVPVMHLQVARNLLAGPVPAAHELLGMT